MDDVRIGRICRALRIRAHLTQRGLGSRAGLSQQAVSLVERGHGSRLSGVAVRRVFAALDARWEPTVSWRGGDLDRLLDARHAALVGLVVALLSRLGWRVEVEVTDSSYVKSELVSVEATIRKLDEKVRLTTESIAETRFGERPLAVASLLVLPDSTTERRRVARAEAVLSRAFPLRTAEARRWLRRPAGAVRALLFLADTNPRSGRRPRAPRDPS